MKIDTQIQPPPAAAESSRKMRQRKLAIAVPALVVLALCLVLPETALAAKTPWDTTGQKVLAIFTGGLTRTFAIISVIACGIAAMAGKLSWDWAIKITIGIVLIFGATAIVDYIVAAAS